MHFAVIQRLRSFALDTLSSKRMANTPLVSISRGFAIISLFSLLVLIPTQKISAQAIQRNQSIAAYLYNFPKHIEWKNDGKLKNFHIIMISENKELIAEIQKISKTARIKNKPILLTVLNGTQDRVLADAQLIFITQDKIDLFLEVFDLVEGLPILLVSENLKDKRFAMINLYDAPNNRLQFEVNKANIINQTLSIDDEILFLGGNLIDVAELYRKSQQSLRGMQKEMELYEKKLDTLNSQIYTVQSTIYSQSKAIKEQNDLIEKQQAQMAQQLNMIDSQKDLLSTQHRRLIAQRDSISLQLEKLKTTEKVLLEQKGEVEKGRNTLLKQQQDIQKMNNEIQSKSDELSQLGVRFTRQKNINIFFGVVIALVTTLVILIFRAYRSIRLKSDQLKTQKVEIEMINEELKATNEELNSKNEEITITLEKLKDTQNQLVRSEKMASLGVLTAGIAHELNNPINFVYAGVNSLKKDFNDIVPILEEIKQINPNSTNIDEIVKSIQSKKVDYLFDEAYEGILQTIDAIGLGADRTAEIIQGLRNFSRLDKEEWKSIDLHSNIDNVLILLKNKYKNHVEIIKDYCVNLPPLECIPGKINQVLMNILNNAIEAIEGKGQVIIKTYSDNGYLTISIKDSGKGMPEEVRSKIFDPFFTTKEIGKGVGLGLSITYGIIQEHNGDIDVISEDGIGSEFIVKLPLIQEKKL